MKPFLKSVAEDIYSRFNGKLDNIAVVFPNKRAGLFFNEYLLQCSGNVPIWSPRYMTINELFQQNSDLVIGDPILLISKLYKEYIRPKRDDESQSDYEKSVEEIDSFYYWGEMLLRDFDDIDKNLADAKRLFSNIKELRAMGTGKDTLTPEQQECIERFFKNFNPEAGSDVKNNFQTLWERMYSIYCNFKERLRGINVAYEGMLYRDVIEGDKELCLKHDKYIFVGFNALNGAETKLFKRIKECGKALFYWDYDRYYLDSEHHEAGHFMRKNLAQFPNALENETFRNLEGKKNVSVVSAGTDSISARYVSTWLNENLTKENVDTAIVLCDETLLEPVLHTIPQKANGQDLESLNVTMGYPIQNTPIFTLVKMLVELQTRGWNEKNNAFTLSHVCKLLKHPYVIQGSGNTGELYTYLLKNNVFYPGDSVLHKDEFLKLIFTHCTDNGEWIDNLIKIIYTIAENRMKIAEKKEEMYEKLFSEAIMKVHNQAQRLKALHSAGELQMKKTTVGRLFIKMLSSLSMPFHGEPVAGLQVMGLLETRNLDFKNIILLSVNEGALPKASSESSFIPYNLRRAFGLTLSEHRDSIYSYYFFRLMQRASNVTLVYNSSTDSKNRGECSRYILQLLSSNLYDINKISLSAQQERSGEITMRNVRKTDEMIKRLRERFDYSYSRDAMEMSPSAINRYINCGLSFFYYYVLGLKPVQEINAELKPTDFGTIFHTAAEFLYNKLTANGNRIITRNMLEYYTKNGELLYEFVNKAFKKEFFKDGKVEYNGEQYINRGVLHNFLLRLTKIDADYTDFIYIGGERSIRIGHPLKCNGFDVALNIGGKIDRIDVKGDTVNIVDYKTGSADSKGNITLDEIFGNSVKTAGNRLQAFLYSIALDKIINEGIDITGEEGLEWIDEVRKSGATKVSPSLLYMRKKKADKQYPTGGMNRDEWVLKLGENRVTDIGILKDEFMTRLNEVLYEIFDKDKEFTFAKDEKNCNYCDYKDICGRKLKKQ